ncbi:translation elongation factor Ts [Methylophilaceae bacterium]|jgi:elongation factor Ts|nr:translation elongation factor Ts [Methylophilaceae bacterium]MDB2703460.1 translation elongation factor Ts [Methylophilaceae bacterium]|tara:strand:+ start:1992 stop:2864 length:873 start_codon:yes stop_codon:yes gene_type:complete
MAEITAKMVMSLRAKTDAPMMDCKKALSEAEGDATRAEEILRVRFGNKASKASTRVAAEGIVACFIEDNKKKGVLVEVNSETDFCAKNDEFLAFVQAITKAAVENDVSDADQLSNLSINDKTIEEIRTQLIGKIGENITIRRVEKMIAKDNLFSYNHGGKVGVIVDIQSTDENLGKDIAMHIAATKPKALDQSGVSQDLIEAERRVAIEKAKEAGKPDEMLEKIATGTVNKFLKEITLLNQVFVKDDKQTIEQLLKNNNSAINGFKFFIVGEGIEKKEVDFASEVAAAQQ